MRNSQAKHAVLLLLTIVAPCAYGSFGGAPCREDFGCHFVVWGVIVGVVAGIPLSCLAFIVLHVYFCNPERSKIAQAIVGAIIGVVVYELAAAGGAFAGTRGKDPMLGLLVVWGILAVASVLYVRSCPRQQVLRSDRDAA